MGCCLAVKGGRPKESLVSAQTMWSPLAPWASSPAPQLHWRPHGVPSMAGRPFPPHKTLQDPRAVDELATWDSRTVGEGFAEKAPWLLLLAQGHRGQPPSLMPSSTRGPFCPPCWRCRCFEGLRCDRMSSGRSQPGPVHALRLVLYSQEDALSGQFPCIILPPPPR
ncbi:hypothetical protein E2I00_005080 [Balaenoptera physalus]|uniref:Uncharacterized protein n=1 Tax=Balaenoptera physalus TaxID=9770 RepID=A0A643CGM4_BALPH|nr:hypothetical protein E2I00_005080 [Balaenoptera physalus]